MSELKPCPFCGSEAKRFKEYGDERNGYADFVGYRCVGCHVSKGARGDTSKPGYADNSKIEERAIENWNCRTQPEATKGDSLRTSLADLAMALWRTHYRNDSPNFELLPDPAGILSQIDNMVSGLVKPEATKPAQDESDEDTWRRLALQFDGHRMMALSHLRAMLQDAQKHAPLVEAFLKATPLDGEVILAQRVASLAPAKDLSAAIPDGWQLILDSDGSIKVHSPNGAWCRASENGPWGLNAGQILFRLASAMIASPADALVAGDRVDAERYRAYRVSAAACMSGVHSEKLDSLLDAIIQAQKDGHG